MVDFHDIYFSAGAVSSTGARRHHFVHDGTKSFLQFYEGEKSTQLKLQRHPYIDTQVSRTD